MQGRVRAWWLVGAWWLAGCSLLVDGQLGGGPTEGGPDAAAEGGPADGGLDGMGPEGGTDAGGDATVDGPGSDAGPDCLPLEQNRCGDELPACELLDPDGAPARFVDALGFADVVRFVEQDVAPILPTDWFPDVSGFGDGIAALSRPGLGPAFALALRDASGMPTGLPQVLQVLPQLPDGADATLQPTRRPTDYPCPELEGMTDCLVETVAAVPPWEGGTGHYRVAAEGYHGGSGTGSLWWPTTAPADFKVPEVDRSVPDLVGLGGRLLVRLGRGSGSGTPPPTALRWLANDVPSPEAAGTWQRADWGDFQPERLRVARCGVAAIGARSRIRFAEPPAGTSADGVECSGRVRGHLDLPPPPGFTAGRAWGLALLAGPPTARGARRYLLATDEVDTDMGRRRTHLYAIVCGGSPAGATTCAPAASRTLPWDDLPTTDFGFVVPTVALELVPVRSPGGLVRPVLLRLEASGALTATVLPDFATLAMSGGDLPDAPQVELAPAPASEPTGWLGAAVAAWVSPTAATELDVVTLDAARIEVGGAAPTESQLLRAAGFRLCADR